MSLQPNNSFNPKPLRSSKMRHKQRATFCLHYAVRVNSGVSHHMWASCILKSDTHLIDSESLRLLASDELNIRAARVDDRRIRVYVRAPDAGGTQGHVHHAHHAIKALVLSLNIGSLGHFYWENGSSANPVLTLTDTLDTSTWREVELVMQTAPVDFGQPRSFSPMDEYRSVLLFGVFARGSAHVLEDEYCRGLLLFHMQFYDIDFRRDAFMCFYRVLEHFVTRRVLGKPKLQNELREIQSCISKLGFGEDLADEIRELYAVRSGQTAHAQNVPRAITGDEVMKLKIFVDALLNKVLLAEADGIMEAMHGSRADG